MDPTNSRMARCYILCYVVKSTASYLWEGECVQKLHVKSWSDIYKLEIHYFSVLKMSL